MAHSLFIWWKGSLKLLFSKDIKTISYENYVGKWSPLSFPSFSPDLQSRSPWRHLYEHGPLDLPQTYSLNSEFSVLFFCSVCPYPVPVSTVLTYTTCPFPKVYLLVKMPVWRVAWGGEWEMQTDENVWIQPHLDTKALSPPPSTLGQIPRNNLCSLWRRAVIDTPLRIPFCIFKSVKGHIFCMQLQTLVEQLWLDKDYRTKKIRMQYQGKHKYYLKILCLICM